jgi:hypothetical protein
MAFSHRAVAARPGAQVPFERPHADEEPPPGHGNAIQCLGEELQAFLRHEPSKKPYDRHIVVPAERSSNRRARFGIRMESSRIDTWRDDARPVSRDAAAPQHIEDRAPERDDAIGAIQRAPLDPAERRRIAFGDVLKGCEHERHTSRRGKRHLARRGDVRLFPAVNEVPVLAQKREKRTSVEHQVDGPRAVRGQGRQRAFLAWLRFGDVPAEVAVKSCRSGRRDFPLARRRQFVRETPVHTDRVRVGNRQQTPARPKGLHAGLAGRASNAGHSRRSWRQRRMLDQRTGLRVRHTPGKDATSAFTIQRRPPGSATPPCRRIAA